MTVTFFLIKNSKYKLKLVIGMAQTLIMSVCTNYIKVLYLPIINKF